MHRYPEGRRIQKGVKRAQSMKRKIHVGADKSIELALAQLILGAQVLKISKGRPH